MAMRQLEFYTASALAACLVASSPALFALNPHKALTQYSRGVWTQAQGLPQDTIRAITQTGDGFLWLGTDEGLSSFDGYDFVTFTRGDGSLPNNSVSALATGRDGTLWIGTPGGLTRYRNHRFTTFKTKDGLPDDAISSLVEDRAGTLWIVAGSFLSRFENGKFYNYPVDGLNPVRAPRVVYRDRQDVIWVAGLEGLIKLSGETFVPVLGPEKMAGNLINTMIKDRDNNVWLGGLKSLILLQPDGQLKNFYTHGHPENSVSALWEDREGNLWAGTTIGLRRLDGPPLNGGSPARDSDVDSVRCLFEDREGNLWVGRSSGLNRFQDERFTIFGHAEGLPLDKPIAVHQDQKGQVWIGYNGGGLVPFREGTTRAYTTQNGLASNQIQAIRETANGDLLISTAEGLSRMHAGHFSNFVVSEPLARPYTFDALEDRNGSVWLATPSGVYEMKGSQAHNVIPGGPAINDSAVVLAEDRDGSIWAGSYGKGLWHIQKGVARRYTTADGLSSDRIRCLDVDQEGTLWIGTWGGGLNAFRSGTFTRYGESNGLLSDNVWHIEDGRSGSLWLSTPRGICRVSKRDIRDFAAGKIRTLSPINYGMADGLPTAQCAPNQVGGGGTRTSDGRLWFPTSRGLAVTDPRAAVNAQTEAAPIVQFIDVAADNQRVNLSPVAVIKPGPKHIQFRFVGVHLSAPEQVRYSYKLEGLDSDWVSGGNRRAVNYIGLPQGQYRFWVRASIPGQRSSESSLAVEVRPHFYEQAYFLWLSAFALLAAMYGLYQLHLRQIRRRFALVLAERARIAREIHDTLVQGFVGISAQLAVALRSNINDEEARRHMVVARSMARHSLTEARSSMLDLRAAPLAGRDLASALWLATRRWVAGTPVPVEVDVAGVPRGLPQDVEQNVLRIAQEAVTNAVKHADATRISIQLQFRPESLDLTVSDNGRGFDTSGVFSLAEGQFGLMGMRERAQRLNGQMDLTSAPGSGTQVHVTFPIDRASGHPICRQRFLNRLKTLLHPVRT
jgi:signal transduction histidine kinase/ligand-binding sensor domain-containing protein